MAERLDLTVFDLTSEPSSVHRDQCKDGRLSKTNRTLPSVVCCLGAGLLRLSVGVLHRSAHLAQ